MTTTEEGRDYVVRTNSYVTRIFSLPHSVSGPVRVGRIRLSFRGPTVVDGNTKTQTGQKGRPSPRGVMESGPGSRTVGPSHTPFSAIRERVDRTGEPTPVV